MTASENGELFLAARDAYNAGDIDAFMKLHALDVEGIPDAAGGFPESTPLRGHAEFRSFIEGIRSAWAGSRWETAELYAVGADRVVHRGEWGGEGATSGDETASSITGVFTIRDGQIARAEWYFDHDRALKALGQRESAVEAIIRAVDAFNRGDPAWVDFCSPDVDWEENAEGENAFPGFRRHYRGHEGVRQWWQDLREAFESFHVELEEVMEGPDGRVLWVGVISGRGRGSGMEPPPLRVWSLGWLKDRKIVRRQVFWDAAAGYKAAGLVA